MKDRSRLASFVAFAAALCAVPRAQTQEKPVAIAASTVLDGRGQVLHDMP